jgi:hypothetical protein
MTYVCSYQDNYMISGPIQKVRPLSVINRSVIGFPLALRCFGILRPFTSSVRRFHLRRPKSPLPAEAKHSGLIEFPSRRPGGRQTRRQQHTVIRKGQRDRGLRRAAKTQIKAGHTYIAPPNALDYAISTPIEKSAVLRVKIAAGS